MAFRVLGRPIFHFFITSSPKPFFPLSNLKPKSFSTNTKYPIPNSQEFSQKSKRENLNPLLSLFQRYGFPPSELHEFLNKNHFLLNLKYSDIEKSLKILLSLNSCRKFVVSIVFSCPRVLDFEFLKNWRMGILEIGVSNLSSLAIQNIIGLSRKFDFTPDDLCCCVRGVKGLGFSDITVCRVLEVSPEVILFTSGEIIRDKINFLEGIGIQRNGIDWIFGKFPGVLGFGLENRLKPLLHEFMDLSCSLVEVKKEIVRDPKVLGLEVGELSQCLRMIRSLKCRISVKEKIFCDGAFRAGYEVKLRVDCLCKYGLIRRDAFTVLWKEPRVILYDIEDIERKIDFLVNKMKFDVLWLVEVPEYLGVNFEKQIVPRYTVIEYLRSKGGLGDEVGLKSLIKLSRVRFHNLYVKPYPECERIYGRFAGEVELKNQHPVGMWKLFKPQKYPESKEDVKNIRSFMEPLGQVVPLKSMQQMRHDGLSVQPF